MVWCASLIFLFFTGKELGNQCQKYLLRPCFLSRNLAHVNQIIQRIMANQRVHLPLYINTVKTYISIHVLAVTLNVWNMSVLHVCYTPDFTPCQKGLQHGRFNTKLVSQVCVTDLFEIK